MKTIGQPDKSAQQARLASQALPETVIDSLFDSNPLPMWIYDLQSLRFLAVNESAIDHYGYTREDFLAMTIADIRPTEDLPALLENVEQVKDQLDRAGVWRHLKKDASQIFVEITSHPLDFMDRQAELVIAYDVTARIAVESNLNSLLQMETLIAQISRDLTSCDSLDETINGALRQIGTHSGAGRAYLFHLDAAEKRMSNTHEWCADGVEPQQAFLQDLPTDEFHWLLTRLLRGLTVSITDVQELPPEADNERVIIEQQGIKSLIMVPVHMGQKVSGFLGFDNVLAAEQWRQGVQRLLEVAAELIGAALQRRRDRDELQCSAQQLDSIMRSAEHFVFYRLALDQAEKHGANVEFVSDSLRNIIGVEGDASFDAWFSHVHPEDLPQLETENARASENGTPLDLTIRMFHPHQPGWRWIRVVSNPVRDAGGRTTHYNGFLLDVTDMVEVSQALQAERDFAKAVMDTVAALVVVMDHAGRIVQFNRACEKATGYTFDEVQGRFVWDFLLLPEERNKVQQVFRDLESLHIPNHFENYWLTKDGRELLISWSNTTILDEQGELLYGIATGIDITQRKHAELAIRKLSSAVEQTANGVIIVDQQGRVEYANSAYVEFSGHTQASLIGKPAPFLGMPDNHSVDQARIWEHMLAGDNWRGEMQQPDKTGNPCWMSVTVSPIRNPDSEMTHFAVLIEDITKLKHAHENLERLASYDTLTGLPNRRMFRERLEHAVSLLNRHTQRLALLYLDLDNFKRVNDSLGHDIGDILLSKVAQRLTDCVRRDDTVARLGGDEFVILLQGVSEGFNVDALAHKILQQVKAPVMAAEHEVVITCSIGITLAPSDSMDPGILLRNADLAMYRSKNSGRDGYEYFEGKMNLEASRRLSMEAELRQALKMGQVEPYFQPIVRLNDMQIIGFEALARWQHPQHGFISPEQFIPVAEDCGLIIPLGEYLLERAALEMLQLRQAHGADLYVAVNVSARQAQDAKLADLISDVLQSTGLPAEALRLEITESLLMKDFSITRTLLERLREKLGTRVAIDDFGTGYSSLSYLKRLPIDTLKVDRSFVQDIPTDDNDMEITAAIIAMAQALKKDVVAEGIETRAQMYFLQARGCDFGQGYLFGRPVQPSRYLNELLFVQLPA